ncbi:YaiI/YqxD family protein [Algihabitans albus]|uniref:YaiI/YqxD family protein n=1 Tax=Algihabitans albus TaxID=2164067 RepID=UPI000E5C79D9|nr:YaiI/YqxD family protein [Algihabitans albus]
MSADPSTADLSIYVDADACPVKTEIYRVAERYGLKVYLVANDIMSVPRDRPDVELVVVSDRFDAADDWIAERAGPSDIVVTNDVPLASRCVKSGAYVLAPNGRVFSSDSIGMSLAVRNLMQDLRAGGEILGGPAPFSKKDRSTFLSALDLAANRVRRRLRT